MRWLTLTWEMLNYTSIRLTCVHCNLNCRNSQNYFIGSLYTVLWYLLLIKFPVLSWDHHSALKHVFLSISLQLSVQNTNVNINFLQFPIRTNSAIMLRTKSRAITSEDRMDALLSDCPMWWESSDNTRLVVVSEAEESRLSISHLNRCNTL